VLPGAKLRPRLPVLVVLSSALFRVSDTAVGVGRAYSTAALDGEFHGWRNYSAHHSGNFEHDSW